MKEIFLKNGFSKYSKFIDNKEIEQIRLIYDQILDDIEGTAHLRSDLSGKGDIGEEKSIFSSYKNMKKFLFVILSFFVSSLCYTQKIKSVDEFDIVSATKENYKSYENLFEVKKLITSFGTFQKGDKLLINRPQNGNLLRFSWIAIGKYFLLNAMAMIMYPSSNANTQIVIDCLRIYKPFGGKSAAIIVDFKINDDSNQDGIDTFGNIFNFERAVDTGEVLNQNTTLNKYQAISKLKEANELLKLDRISKEEFDDLKEKLSKIIN